MSAEPELQPEISVVIASVNGLPMIDECLTALEKQTPPCLSEVIVLDCCDETTRRHIESRFPWATLLRFEQRKSIPELRAIGMRRAHGKILAVIEDHCLAPEDWFAQIRDGHNSNYAGVGGPVENGAVDRLVDWAVFLCEYSHVMGPVSEGEVDDIPGNNAAYKRSVLPLLADELDQGFCEDFLHKRIRLAGGRLYWRPAMVMIHKKSFGVREYLRERFHYSRSFAGMRNPSFGLGRRFLYAILTLALPLVLLWRISSRVVSKQRHIDKLILSYPLILVFVTSWAIGEIVGYLFGAGDSLLKVK